MAVVRGFVVFLKYDITGFGGLRNALLRWRYQRILGADFAYLECTSNILL